MQEKVKTEQMIQSIFEKKKIWLFIAAMLATIKMLQQIMCPMGVIALVY